MTRVVAKPDAGLVLAKATIRARKMLGISGGAGLGSHAQPGEPTILFLAQTSRSVKQSRRTPGRHASQLPR